MGLATAVMEKSGVEINATEHCARIVGRSRSNFAPAFRFLDREQKRAMMAVYAFCRVVDDCVDGNMPANEKIARLSSWRENLTSAANSPNPVLMGEVRWAIDTFQIPEKYFVELVDGVGQDLERPSISTFDDLLRYCYGVAGTVGLICLRIFRVEETAQARVAALALANAFQITNILRDLVEDAATGRCYLPGEDMDRFGVTPEHLRAAKPSLQLNALIVFEAERAARFFGDAWTDFNRNDKRLCCARMMSSYYHELLRQIRRDPLRVLCKRVRISWWKKLRLLVCPLHS